MPKPVVDHVRSCLHLAPDLPLGCDQPKTLYRYHAAIREHLNVTSFRGKQARHTAVRAAYRAAEVMDQQTDLINATIDELVGARRKYDVLGRWVYISALSYGIYSRKIDSCLIPA